MNENIIVTGGTGLVGKALQRLMPEAVYLSSKDYDLTKELEVERLYRELKPTVIVHLAGKVGGIIDNLRYPAEYFSENILMNTLLVDHARVNNVKRFIGVLSTCIYPDVLNEYPLKEERLHDGPPTPTNFAYGYAKRCLAVQIDANNKEYATKYQYLTPCNLYGIDDKFGENSHFVPALLKKIHLAKVKGNSKISLLGSGKPLRQFMLVDDFAKVIKYCLSEEIFESFNVATEQNLSIDEIARIALRACDAENLEIEYDQSKPDGQFRKDVSIEKLKSLIPDFQATDLFDGIQSSYAVLKDKWQKTDT